MTAPVGHRKCSKVSNVRTSLGGSMIHSFLTLDRIKKYDNSNNEENAEKPYSIKMGETERTINLYAVASIEF